MSAGGWEDNRKGRAQERVKTRVSGSLLLSSGSGSVKKRGPKVDIISIDDNGRTRALKAGSTKHGEREKCVRNVE